jgi:EAL domain-containing protein (putative c-di-GMP-specific phosphodiesterase class I)
MGIGIAIDDFGTGYSSLAALRQLPITRLKIDRSFVSSLPDNEDDLAIAQMIVRMADSLQLQVTAEGVENAAQVACLRGMGCHELQGYFYARPLTADALSSAWLTQKT